MLDRASPRKPRVLIENKSSTVSILLVWNLFMDEGRSSGEIPDPLSRTCIVW